MTLSIGIISIYDVAVELGIGAAGLNLNDSRVRTLAGVPSGTISLSMLRGKSNTIAGSALIASSVMSYKLPNTSGTTLTIWAIGGGGGGGGGSARAFPNSYISGGGGGGSGAMRKSVISITAGATLDVYVGVGGGGGAARDGPYSSGSNGGTGTHSGVYYNGGWQCLAYGGGQGDVSQINSGIARGGYAGSSQGGAGADYFYGDVGDSGVGSSTTDPKGQFAYYSYGGNGGRGSYPDGTVQTAGLAGIGDVGGNPRLATTGSTYGGGGGGGGVNGGYSNDVIYGAGGSSGIVLLVWG